MISNKNFPLIMGVDSNAHSLLYGPDTNARGTALEDFILQYGLKVENLGTAPTYEIQRGSKRVQTHIDVTLSRGLPICLENWRVNRNYNASDHDSIFFEISSSKQDPELVRPWSKADWTTFKRGLAGADYANPVDMSMKKLDKLVLKVYNILETELNKACPLIKIVPTVKKAYWATDKHDNEKKQSEQAIQKG